MLQCYNVTICYFLLVQISASPISRLLVSFVFVFSSFQQLTRWVYSVKDNPNGNILHKARFVAKGYSQVQGSDYKDTFSPTAKMSTVRMIMQIAAEQDLMVHHLDVKTAYLNAPIDCEVYIHQPEHLKGVLSHFNMADCRPKSTPCEVKLQSYESSDDEGILVDLEKSLVVLSML